MRQCGIAAVAVLAALMAGAGWGVERRSGSAVGMRTLLLEDPARAAWVGGGQRPVHAVVWYPTADRGAATAVAIGPALAPLFEAGAAIREAAIAPGRHGVVLLSHGTGGSALQMMWLGQSLAQAGYIAVAVNHHGNTAAEIGTDGKSGYAPQGFVLWGERARDLSFVLDRMLGDPVWGPAIDARRVGAAGFSLGGFTVALLAGGRIERAGFLADCAVAHPAAACAGPPEMPDAAARFARLAAADPALAAELARSDARDDRDGRVRAAVLIAPALGDALDPASLHGVRVPMLVVGAAADVIAPVTGNAARIAGAVPGARLRVVPRAAHYTFLAECGWLGWVRLPICRDPAGVDRRKVHEAVAGMAVAFLAASLPDTE